MGVLLMLMTVGGVMAAIVLLFVSYLAKMTWLRTFVFGGVAVWFVFYAAMLIGFSIFSSEYVLAQNEPKEFCGFYIDCHMHTAVTGVRTAKTIGDRTANGEFYIVKMKVFSDAKETTLGLITVDAKILDDQKRAYQRDLAAEANLGEQPPFETKIAPAQSFEKEIVFDLPADAKAPRLDLKEGYGIDHAIEAVLVDDEDSIFHKRNYFKIAQQTNIAGVK